MRASLLSSPSTKVSRELSAQRIFRVPPCHTSSIHLQIPMPSPGFEPKLYGTAVSVTAASNPLIAVT
ncbi:hypothetical protein TNCV_3476451 [Trichonephila clavipes]|nr:hypothetical protein TNCV_3476451 [Trichonephila clavipes]